MTEQQLISCLQIIDLLIAIVLSFNAGYAMARDKYCRRRDAKGRYVRKS